MPPDRRGLSAEDVLAHGGWHPGYARVLAVASDGDYGVALVDGTATGQNLKKRPGSTEPPDLGHPPRRSSVYQAPGLLPSFGHRANSLS